MDRNDAIETCSNCLRHLYRSRPRHWPPAVWAMRSALPVGRNQRSPDSAETM